MPKQNFIKIPLSSKTGVKILQKTEEIKPNINQLQKRQIKKLIIDRGITEKEIAYRLGTTPQMICDVIAGRKNAPRYEKGIASILGVSIKKIFPKHQAVPVEAREISPPAH
jgi:lambda repressor-like predicted transcriptional regulator